MKSALLTTLGLVGLPVAAGNPVELTLGNFDATIAGKNAFVKFFAPWCGHCKGMKPAWDALGSEYADSNSVVIGDADCTTPEGTPLCERFNVRGYPTIKYWLDGTEHDYNGERDLEGLRTFVSENLEVKCDALNPSEGCDEKEQGYIAKMKGTDKISREMERLKGMKGSSMKPELKKWLNQRLRILKQLQEAAVSGQEL